MNGRNNHHQHRRPLSPLRAVLRQGAPSLLLVLLPMFATAGKLPVTTTPDLKQADMASGALLIFRNDFEPLPTPTVFPVEKVYGGIVNHSSSLPRPLDVAPDGQGGAVIAWAAPASAGEPARVHARQRDADGAWGMTETVSDPMSPDER
ncbi:hypothetical protein, partial [Dokdonella sp.]|uniref:hypothetical protein n=1 Tax=Dokdonella sp. TaxID=2291710 RepID=UPI0025BFFA17